MLTILTEKQFFEILEGKSLPSENPAVNNDVKIYPAENNEGNPVESGCIADEIVFRKRLDNLADYGVPIPDGRVKIDLRPLNKAANVKRSINEQE